MCCPPACREFVVDGGTSGGSLSFGGDTGLCEVFSLFIYINQRNLRAGGKLIIYLCK